MQRILLAEDDQRLAGLVKDYLESNGFSVYIEANGNKVSSRVHDYRPDLIILDVGLPGKNGMDICQEIRRDYHDPILMLTARNEAVDEILGLEFGADDYIVKPAEPRILLARIRALLRRFDTQAKTESENITVGILDICPTARKVSLGSEPVSLSSHEFDLLLILAQNSGQIMSREFLFNTVYHREYDGLDRTIDVRISQLRKKLGDNAEKPFRIKTIWGKGYLFVNDAW